MIRILPAVLSAAICLLACACGHPDSFRIEGEIEGNPTMNLRVVYAGDGGAQSAVTASREGKFHFDGRASRPAVVEIFDNDYRIIGRTIAVNGRDIHLRLNRENPYDIEAGGYEPAERWAEWTRTRADSLRNASPALRNAMIARYVEAHPSDITAALLLLTEFDSSGEHAAEAARLWALLPDEARPAALTSAYAAMLDRVTSASSREPIAAIPYMKRGGKTEIFKPSRQRLSLIAVTGPVESRDTLVAGLARAVRHRAPGRFEVIELSLVPDTVEWRRSVASDTVKWTQGWIAGGISAGAVGRLGLPETPYYILTDSAGTQLWRGSDARTALSEAVEALSALR